MKPNQYERDQCIEYGARGGMLRVKGNTQRLPDSPNVPDADKRSILKSFNKWAKMVDSHCSGNICYWNMETVRNNELEKIMAKYGVAPL